MTGRYWCPGQLPVYRGRSGSQMLWSWRKKRRSCSSSCDQYIHFKLHSVYKGMLMFLLSHLICHFYCRQVKMSQGKPRTWTQRTVDRAKQTEINTRRREGQQDTGEINLGGADDQSRGKREKAEVTQEERNTDCCFCFLHSDFFEVCVRLCMDVYKVTLSDIPNSKIRSS